MKRLKSCVYSQKGMTLIELLAVVVILAILALIAIPSIGGLIDNTKKDAHVANAQQMVSSARLAIASEQKFTTKDDNTTINTKIDLKQLVEGNYIENMEDPDKLGYDLDFSFVVIKEGIVTDVKLVNAERGVVKGDQNDPVPINELNRDAVKKVSRDF